MIHPQPVHEGDASALAVDVEPSLEREDVRLVLGNMPGHRHRRSRRRLLEVPDCLRREGGRRVVGSVGGVDGGVQGATRLSVKVRTARLHFAGHRLFVLQQVVADVARFVFHEPYILQDGGRHAEIFGFGVLPEVRAGFLEHVLHAVPLEGQRDLFHLGQRARC